MESVIIYLPFRKSLDVSVKRLEVSGIDYGYTSLH